MIVVGTLILVDGRPGRAAVPFLTAETRLVLGVVDLCLVGVRRP